MMCVKLKHKGIPSEDGQYSKVVLWKRVLMCNVYIPYSGLCYVPEFVEPYIIYIIYHI